MKKKAIVLLLVLCMTLGLCACTSKEEKLAQAYTQAQQMYEQKDYDRAYAVLKENEAAAYAPMQELQAQIEREQAYAEAYELYEYRHSYDEAYAILKEQEESGYAPALNLLGLCYENGRGTEKDNDEAFRLYTLAAEKGNALAMANLADCYYGVKGIEQFRAEAEAWYEDATEPMRKAQSERPDIVMLHTLLLSPLAEYGRHIGGEWYKKAAVALEDYITANPDAVDLDKYQCYLADIYHAGRGVEKDYGKALALYEKAAALGNAYGMSEIGWMYYYGYGVEQDYGKAMEWCEKAAALGEANAVNLIGWMYYYGYGVEQDYGKAMEWAEKAAALGSANAMDLIGIMYAKGLGVKQDTDKALEWLEKAVALDHTIAMMEMGGLFRDGIGVEKDVDKALEWFVKAAEAGNDLAFLHLGWMYAQGNGIQQDGDRALRYFGKAIENGEEADAYFGRGWSYYASGAPMYYPPLAYVNFLKAAELGQRDAQRWLGYMYAHSTVIRENNLLYFADQYGTMFAAELNDEGEFIDSLRHIPFIGYEPDYTQAIKWYTEAAEQGQIYAQFEIGELYEQGLGVEKDLEQAAEWYRKSAEGGNADAQKALEKPQIAQIIKNMETAA